MVILFVHQNFPGQFKHLAPALVKRGHKVLALTIKDAPPIDWMGVRVIPYMPARGSTANIHPWVVDIETKIIRAEAAFRAAVALRGQGLRPDLIVAHPGWGESLFLKDVWPEAKLAIYCEFFYHPTGADVGFDPEFSTIDLSEVCRLRLKNLNNEMHFQVADAALSPTQWQASTFPEPFRSKITVVHDGINTRQLKPEPRPAFLPAAGQALGLAIDPDRPVVTFVNRNLEPYRGYHSFMRALPRILLENPRAAVFIVGADGVSYGSAPASGTWKNIFIQEVRSQISDEDWKRVTFFGHLDYERFVLLIRLSTVHVYLTYPFVLSWSLLEAMSLGCAIVGSRTPPVQEVITDAENGLLVDFFSPEEIAQAVARLLANTEERAQFGTVARDRVVQNYDLESICIPKQMQWVESLR